MGSGASGGWRGRGAIGHDTVNPYYATGFMTALIFWVWPVYLFRNLDAHLATVAIFSALLFLGAGKAASEFHIRVLAPKHPPRGRPSSMVIACFVIVVIGALTRAAYRAWA